MIVLPRSNPLYENIPAEKINLPDVLGKMGSGGFTGYMGFASASAEGYALFIKGAMISILLLEGERNKTGFEAINGLYDQILKNSGNFSFYRMTPDIVMSAHALLHGETILGKQEVRTVDLKAVLAKMKVQMLNGTVFFTASDRSAIIFFREGNPVGFYNDAAHDIESSPAEAQKVAALPGASVEIRSTKPADILVHQNLLETINISKLWNSAVARNSTPSPSPPPPVQPSATTVDEISQSDQELASTFQDLAEDLCEIASAYLGRQGAILVSRLIGEAGGNNIFANPEKSAAFLASLSEHSMEIDPEARIKEMHDLIQSEISGRLPA